MKKLLLILVCPLLFAVAGVAQEHFTEGPVWRVTLIKVKPAQMDAYLTSLRQASKPLLDEQKRQGLIMDYKVFLKETQEGPHDWDLALAVQFTNLQVHHKEFRSRSGDDSEDNLITLCSLCHESRHRSRCS